MAVYANISIDQGSDFISTVTVEGSDGIIYNLTGHTARGQIRKSYTSSSYVPFTIELDNPTAGRMRILLSAVQTSAMKPGRYLYDIEITEPINGKITRVVEGQVEVNPRVTRP